MKRFSLLILVLLLNSCAQTAQEIYKAEQARLDQTGFYDTYDQYLDTVAFETERTIEVMCQDGKLSYEECQNN